MRQWLYAFSLLCLLWVGLSPAGESQAGDWSRPQNLGDGWFPDITADSSGQIHVVWTSGLPADETGIAYDLVMYTSSLDGQHWQPGNDIVACPVKGGTEATRPTLLSDSTGQIHLTFRDTTIYYAQAHISQAACAYNWQVTPISQGYYSTLAHDSQNRLHLVYTSNVSTSNCPICYHVYARYRDATLQEWSPAIDVSFIPTGSAKPQLHIDTTDNLFLIWESGVGGAQGQLVDPTTIQFAHSVDRGQSWSNPMQLSLPQQAARQAGLGQDGAGNLVVVWQDTNSDLIYYGVSADRGRSWNTPTPIPNLYGAWSHYQGRLDHAVMVSDSLGHLHLVMVGRRTAPQSGLDLLHLNWNGHIWSTPEPIVSFSGDVPEWPEITIANGNELHVVWFVRPQAYLWSGGQGSQVWYSHRWLDAPHFAPQPLPTQHPQDNHPTSCPSESITTPAPFPISQLSPNPTPQNQPFNSQEQSIKLIIQSVLPSFLVLVLAVYLFCRLRLLKSW
ncbi:MAG: exo-alpha-sialidase [Chloroflexi bacterium]|nr:exo-alpha-sialidase [Chloroflexota bacterium]MBP8054481.1 exo-alpha-sialidase [Chloroflexota bacterium]